MLVSSTSINAASETAAAMIQGLPLGCQLSSPELAAVASLIEPSHRLQRNRPAHNAAVVDVGAAAFKGDFVYRDFHQLAATPIFARGLRCAAVTYCLSEVECFSLIRHKNGYSIARSAAAADVNFFFRIFLIAMHDRVSQSLAERQLDVAFCSLNTLAILESAASSGLPSPKWRESRSASSSRFPRCENGSVFVTTPIENPMLCSGLAFHSWQPPVLRRSASGRPRR